MRNGKLEMWKANIFVGVYSAGTKRHIRGRTSKSSGLYLCFLFWKLLVQNQPQDVQALSLSFLENVGR